MSALTQLERLEVSISTEVKKEKEGKAGSRVLLKENHFGSVARVFSGFSLAHEIDDKAVVAKLQDGVLDLGPVIGIEDAR